MQSDPLGIWGGGFSTYGYAAGNPTRYTDPTGRCIGPLIVVCIGLIEYAAEVAIGTEIVVAVAAGVPLPETGMATGASGTAAAAEAFAEKALACEVKQALAAGSTGLASTSLAVTKPIQAGEVTTYRDFVKRSVVGDNLEGHEMWQNANLEANGLASGRLSTEASKDNLVIALDRATHQELSAAQSTFNASNQIPFENIQINAQIMRDLGVAPESVIDQMEQRAVEHAIKNGF